MIGARAWVRLRLSSAPGVTIGEGAVLGARGCTFRDLEPRTVYAGNPVRRLKLRKIRLFDDVDAKS
jgi:putative colanic acid biosynthesis acetyltransferase WcaF